MPRVSVVIASYNHAPFVGAAVESVLAQTFQDFEICVTDDGSADGTADVVAAIADPRIHLVRFAQNRGACVAVNDAIRRARGEYVAVLNSDDMFLPDKLAVQVQFLDDHPGVGAVFGYPMFIDEAGGALPASRNFYGRIFDVENRSQNQWLRLFFYQGNRLCHPTLMIRRECYERVGLYDERLAQLPDLEMWIRLVVRYPIHVIPEVLAMFRILGGEGNASARRPESVARQEFENDKIRRHFLRIDDAQFREVFAKEIVALEIDADAPRAFVLGKICMASDILRLKRLGQNLLFDAMPAQGENGFGVSGFSFADLVRATGADDVLGMVFRKQATEEIAHLSRKVAALEGRLDSDSGPAPAAQTHGWFHRFRR